MLKILKNCSKFAYRLGVIRVLFLFFCIPKYQIEKIFAYILGDFHIEKYSFFMPKLLLALLKFFRENLNFQMRTFLVEKLKVSETLSYRCMEFL